LKQLIIALVWTVLMLFSGWKINTYYSGYQENLKNEVTEVVKQGLADIQAQQAKDLISTLKSIQELDKPVQSELTTIVKQPIYVTQCIDDDGLKLLKDYKDKSNALRTKKD